MSVREFSPSAGVLAIMIGTHVVPPLVRMTQVGDAADPYRGEPAAWGAVEEPPVEERRRRHALLG